MMPLRPVALLLFCLVLVSSHARAADIGPDTPVPPPGNQAPPAADTTARLVSIPEYFEAVGTIRPRTTTRVEAQVTGKILKIHVRPGDRFEKGDALVVLDDRELAARKAQAEQSLTAASAGRDQAAQAIQAAKAAFDRAQAQYKRIKNLFTQEAVTRSEMDVAEADYLAAEATLNQTRDGLARARADVRAAAKRGEETTIAQDYATIRALDNGQVTERFAEPGDLAFPGKTLLEVRTGGGLRLEAMVREGLIGAVRTGQSMSVSIPALGRMDASAIEGVVEEVVPNADPLTRTFVVKVALPATPGLYPGMFGRLLVPMGERQAVLVEARAVKTVGQIRTVTVKTRERWESVYVTTGRTIGEDVEVLSGLAGGETVALPLGAERGNE